MTSPYPIVIVDAHSLDILLDDGREAVDIEEAQVLAEQLGYCPIDEGEGGNCETTSAWQPERGAVHVVTVDTGGPTTSIARDIAEQYGYDATACLKAARRYTGVNVDEDWDAEIIEYTFTDDGSVLQVCGGDVWVEDSTLGVGQ